MGRGRKVAVVTGASSGIGLAVALRLARQGYDVVLAARDAVGLADVEERCRRYGVQAHAVPTDVADEAAVQRLVATAVDRLGRVDVFVGAAGVWSYGRFEDTPSTVFRQVVETTLLGQVHGARAVLPVFRAQGSGVLVLVSSLYGRLSAPLVSSYVAAKWGVVGFADSLRHELRDSPGIEVVTVLPPATDTPIYQHAANYTGREIRPPHPVTSPDRVARAVVRAVRRPRRQVAVGVVQRSGVWLHHLAPGIYDRVAPRTVAALSLRRRPVEAHDGNVFAPVRGPEPVSGGWRARDRRRAAVATVAVTGAVVVARAVRERLREPSGGSRIVVR